MCVEAVESELGQVMLAYTVLFLFSAKTLCLNLCKYVYSFTGILELDDSDDCASMCIRLQVFLSWTILMTV